MRQARHGGAGAREHEGEHGDFRRPALARANEDLGNLGLAGAAGE